ncbi:MAG: DUF2934 domain-containing protein [Verrucomicrobia bacterium]|nr:DUF2934 domain-containing protein [Verrucomicrobiota bacterium]
MNAAVYSTPCETSNSGPHPSDKEIALLAFKNWKKEGCSHLRPEHWLKAEKELVANYAAQGPAASPVDSERLEEFWEQEMEAISCYTMDSELSLATKGWS